VALVAWLASGVGAAVVAWVVASGSEFRAFWLGSVVGSSLEAVVAFLVGFYEGAFFLVSDPLSELR
jgi:hypothetical protein